MTEQPDAAALRAELTAARVRLHAQQARIDVLSRSLRVCAQALRKEPPVSLVAGTSRAGDDGEHPRSTALRALREAALRQAALALSSEDDLSVLRAEPGEITLTGRELLAALSAAVGDQVLLDQADEEALDTEVTLWRTVEPRALEDGEVLAPGAYLWYTEYPEEGALPLSGRAAGPEGAAPARCG